MADDDATSAVGGSHLLGEKDVLAAITCEFLDENAPKKDTAAASVSLGKVRMTTFRFSFAPDEHEYERARAHLLQRSDAEIASFFSVPLGCIASIKKKNSVIEIGTKDLRQMSFRFDVVEVTRIFTVLMTYVFPDKIDFLFAFYHRLSRDFQSDQELIPCSEDWGVYDETLEWERQGVFENGRWRISHLNKDFREIETYPELIVVPTSISDAVLKDATGFRSIGRIPSLCWLNKANGATLTRASQPKVQWFSRRAQQIAGVNYYTNKAVSCVALKVGMSKATSPADESLVAAIASSSLLRDFLHIIDCRPMTNAMANRAKGYGVESTVNYKNCSISFMNIPNIHSMRDSMKKVRALCSSTTLDNLQWLGNVEDTKWLVYVRQLLKSSLHVTALLRQGESVLLHCSHGWDRTSQIAALSQLILDPYYRTWEGFQVLIEKEWLSFGHPFQLRLSHGEKADTQESPIFVQFLDCVWQLLCVYPSYFEFNEGLLLMLIDALHSCRFGTFLFDCKKLRKEADLENRTASVWTWLNGFRSQLTEPTFVPNRTLDPPVTGLLKRVGLWESMLLRWSAQPLLHEPPMAAVVHANFVSENAQRIPTWQLPQGTINALSAALSERYKEAQLIQQLSERVTALEKQLQTESRLE